MKASVYDLFAHAFAKQAEDLGCPVVEGWPSAEYRADPVRFCREVLGVEPWAGQVKILEAVRDHKRVAVASGNKVGKSCSIATVILWWYCSWPDAIVVMTAPTSRQVERVVWKEVRRFHARSQRPIPLDDEALVRNPGLKTKPIDGEPHVLSRSGLVSGLREVTGFTAQAADDVSGFSGAHMLIVVDEGSGVEDEIYEAFEGVRGGGGRIVILSNPTRSEGELYEAFNSKVKTETNPTGYHSFRISSRDTPNAIEGREVIPGLATRDYCDERLREWGEKSPLYRIRVLGEFCEYEQGKIVSIKTVIDAEKRWKADGEDAVAGEGVLHIGIDPAFAESGDEAIFVPRRGKRIFEIRAERGLRDENGHLAVLLDLLKQYAMPGELVVVNLDALGDVGSKVFYLLRDYKDKHPGRFVLCGLRGSDNAIREPEAYLRVRDELWGAVTLWLEDGGAIPEDPKLTKDLHAPSWTFDLKNRKIATKKDELRRVLGRSPDRGDAVCLAVWENAFLVERELEFDKARQEAPATKPALLDEPASRGLDPYAGLDQWR